MSRLPNPYLAQVKAASFALQARTKAENDAAPHSSRHLRVLATEKEASAALLLKQYDTRCATDARNAFKPETCALWQGHYALLEKARDLRRMADEADADGAAATSVNTQTHRVTASA